jgi:NhaP-type Na+/H+ or K+/H+ antiporter
VCFGIIFLGNLIYSLNRINPTIRKIWKLVFPIVILQWVFSGIADSVYGTLTHDGGVVFGCIVWIIDFAFFFPTFRAHYLIGYGKKVIDDIA